MKNFKKKIALLLAIVMILATVPANLFAAGTVGPPQPRRTAGRTEASGSVMYTAQIPANLLTGMSTEFTTVHQGTWGHLLHVELVGGTTAYPVHFPEDNRWATSWETDDTWPVGYVPSNNWPLVVDSTNTRGIYASRPADETWDPARELTAQFHNMIGENSTQGWISFGFEPAFDDLVFIDGLEDLEEDLAEAIAHLAYANTFRTRFTAIRNAISAFETSVTAIWEQIEDYMDDEGLDGTDDVADLDADLVAALAAAFNTLNAFMTATTTNPASSHDDIALAALMNGIVGPMNAAVLTALSAPILVAPVLNTVVGLEALADIDALEARMDAILDLVARTAAGVPVAGATVAIAVDAAWVLLMDEVATAQQALAMDPPMTGPGNLVQDIADIREALVGPDGLLAENPILTTLPLIPTGATGTLSVTIPVHRVNHADAEMIIRRGGPNGPVVARGYLLDTAAAGVTVHTGPVVYFENSVTLNQITIREVAAGALTDNLASHNYDNPDRALAIRLTAPVGYTWERTDTSGAGMAWAGQQWANNGRVRRVPRTFPYNPDTNQPLYVGPPHFPAAPHITSPFNLLQWHCTVDGTFMHANRQELVIIFDNLTRNPDLLAHVPAELHIHNLRLQAGPNAAPATADVNIDVRVGIVCAWGHIGWGNTLPNPELRIDCAFEEPVPTAPPGAPPAPRPTPGESLRPTTPPTVCTWVPDGDYDCVTQDGRCFFFNGIERFPNSLNELEGRATTGNVLQLSWNHPDAISVVGDHTNLTVARRVTAGFTVHVTGDPAELRSGDVTGTTNTVIRTGTTRQLEIREVVPGALALSQSRPITFTFPEGVHVVGVNYSVTEGGLAASPRNINQPFTHVTQFVAPNVVTIANNLPVGRVARNLNIRFELSVEAGFAAANNTDEINVEISGLGVTLLADADRTQTVATVWDPITLSGVEPIQMLPFVGREQNIIHTSIGDEIVIEETRPGALRLGEELWIFVAQRYGIGHPLFISRGTTVIGEAGFGLTVTETRDIGASRGIRLEVTSISSGEAGRITLSGTELFGHVYQGEVYYFVVTGNAVAANHTWVAGNVPGAWANVPYGQYVIEYVAVDDPATPTPTPEPTPGPRANSIAGHTFSPTNMVGEPPAPEMIWYRAPGMNHQGGFVQLRAFADLVGATDINWVASTRVATVAGWTWDGQWVTITMTQGSPWAQISLGTTEGARDLGTTRVDIAEFSDGLTGPTGTVVPVFQNNRIYVPFRFVFNAFGYSADYGLARDGNVARVVPN